MEITANASQTVNAGNNVLFTSTPVPGNCSIIHREGSGLVSLRGLTQQCRARFRISFNGNIAIPSGTTVSAATAISLAIAMGGEALGAATMISTQAAAGTYNNVSATTFIDVPSGCCAQVSVQNNGSEAVSVENANLIVERVA